MKDLQTLFEISSRDHNHLCPRQILGVRLGLAGAAALVLEPPIKDKRLLVVTETDGCFVDGVTAATGCTVGHRTLRVEDYGKAAATFVDTHTGRAVRVAASILSFSPIARSSGGSSNWGYWSARPTRPARPSISSSF